MPLVFVLFTDILSYTWAISKVSKCLNGKFYVQFGAFTLSFLKFLSFCQVYFKPISSTVRHSYNFLFKSMPFSSNWQIWGSPLQTALSFLQRFANAVQVSLIFEYSLFSLPFPVLLFPLNFKIFLNLHNSFKCYINNLFLWTIECNLPTRYPVTPYDRQGYFPM